MTDLKNVIQRITKVRESSGVRVRGGRRYTMVQDRVEALRQETGDSFSIITEIMSLSEKLPNGQNVIVRAEVRSEDGRTLATGHASEVWQSSDVNTTSAIENAETSAIGRALAALGIHGGEFASVNELEAVERKSGKPILDRPETPAKPMSAEEIRELVKLLPQNAAEAKTIKELNSLWTKNTANLEKLKGVDEDNYKAIFDAFANRKKELKNGNEDVPAGGKAVQEQSEE